MITLHLNDQIIKSLSRPELNILKYAYENMDELMELSIQDLSNRVSYSPATVLRFCKKLGYSGFSEFKYALRAEQRRKGEDISSHSSRNFSTGMMIDTLSSNIQATSKLIQEEAQSDVPILRERLSHLPLVAGRTNFCGGGIF